MRAIFLDDEKREKRASWLNLAFTVLVLLGLACILYASAFFIGDQNGYARAALELKVKAATRYPPVYPDPYHGMSDKQCAEHGHAIYMQCRMSQVRQKG